jgi:thymidylate synthase (FAD)
VTGVPLTVRAVAWTRFDAATVHELTGWSVDDDTDPTSGQALAEFAGRACYQSWTKPNPATATNAGYLAHILDVGHLSVLEHGTVTFYLTGVSRSLTHELVRHRHFSYSQLSQRYVRGDDAGMVEPDVIAGDPYLHRVFTEAVDRARVAYRELVHGLERTLGVKCPTCRSDNLWKVKDPPGYHCKSCEAEFFPTLAEMGHIRTAIKKAARQAARAVLPNATETRIVVTGNYRAWRHFIAMRATEHADVEIRAAAVAILAELQRVAKNVFWDFTVETLPDGTQVATTPIGGQP